MTTYNTLIKEHNKNKDDIVGINEQLAENVQEINSLETQVTSIASGSPKGVYPTLLDLQTAFPTGDTNIYVVTADGKWYYWSGSVWTDGGVYQSTGLADNGVTVDNLSKNFNLLQTRYKQAGKRLDGYDTGTLLPVISTNANYVVMIIPCPNTGTLRIYKPTLASGQAVLVGKNDDTVYPLNVSRTVLNEVGNKVGDWLEVFATHYEIYIDNLKTLYPLCGWLYLGFATSTFSSAYIYGVKTMSVNDFEWLKNENAITNWNEILNKPNDTRSFVVPPHIPCVVGKTENLYLDNVLKYGDFYTAEKYLVKNKAGLIEGAYQYSPSSESVQETLTLEYYNGSIIEKQANVIVKPVPLNAGSGITKKCLFIGESTTDNNDFIPELYNLFNTDVMNIELLGSRGVAPSLHEGRSGWSSNDYFSYEDKDKTNAFYNPSTTTFDFSYYMSQMSYASIDYVFINLGINDTVESIPLATTLANYNDMLSSIKAFNSDIKVFIGLTSLPCKWKNQYYYGKPLKEPIQTLLQTLISTFGSRENEGIYLTPIYTNIDPYWDMQYSEVPISTRNPKTVFVGTDSVHPSLIGYKKMADTHYNMIKYVVSLE